MTDIWSGDILLPDQTAVKDVCFASPKTASVILSTAPLRFLATVDTARIPLYLAAGPSLDVWTTSEDTQEWFSSMLLREPATVDTREWWTWARAQSPMGILVQVQGDQLNPHGPRITEILLYGTIAAPAPGALPTPPSSSPPHAHALPDGEPLPELRVHALPLSSELLYKQTLPETAPPSPALPAAESPISVEPQFLPPFSTSEQTPNSPKRKRDVFDEAAQAQKRQRNEGGEGVAAAAAKAQESQRSFGHRKSLSIDTKAFPYPDSRPQSAHALARPSPRPLSRSPSIASDTRPLSRKGVPDGHTKRSALSQVATVALQPEEPTTESRNKETLSRVVMAAMRMQGLQQRKRNKSRTGSIAPGVNIEEQSSEEQAKDEEYKLIYHQTYKSAVLAFRKHMSSKPLHSQPDRLRDVVERLLTIFCTDPLAHPLSEDTVADPLTTPGRGHLAIPGSNHGRASPFDLPSGTRPTVSRSNTQPDARTGSPVNRRQQEKEMLPA
ncbi:hypothetical protein BU23DRAFT_571025 [Bimuria novae-zelandiae CBS 107.79]|uniref:Sld7 C-terminal domain-containing protein n=1 Tax=Bimuria novae-zelandiae CBS 107.79 TaxID=1447943 RepID=A0A6A5UYJ2_9PLEO|nr:hypothetical protein BU23DRAFT_571025 [Bimuria novae-zelandiae CBS 107.79]